MREPGSMRGEGSHARHFGGNMQRCISRQRRGEILRTAAAMTLACAMAAEAADKFYVGPASGASAIVNTTASWSLTNGGASGVTVPNGTDRIRFNHNDATSRSVLLDTNITLTGGAANQFQLENTGAGID